MDGQINFIGVKMPDGTRSPIWSSVIKSTANGSGKDFYLMPEVGWGIHTTIHKDGKSGTKMQRNVASQFNLKRDISKFTVDLRAPKYTIGHIIFDSQTRFRMTDDFVYSGQSMSTGAVSEWLVPQIPFNFLVATLTVQPIPTNDGRHVLTIHYSLIETLPQLKSLLNLGVRVRQPGSTRHLNVAVYSGNLGIHHPCVGLLSGQPPIYHVTFAD